MATLSTEQKRQYVESCKFKAEIEAILKLGCQHQEQAPITLEAEDNGGWLTVDEAVAYSKYSKRTVQKAYTSGKLKSHGTGRNRRITKSALERWVKTKE